MDNLTATARDLVSNWIELTGGGFEAWLPEHQAIYLAFFGVSFVVISIPVVMFLISLVCWVACDVVRKKTMETATRTHGIDFSEPPGHMTVPDSDMLLYRVCGVASIIGGFTCVFGFASPILLILVVLVPLGSIYLLGICLALLICPESFEKDCGGNECDDCKKFGPLCCVGWFRKPAIKKYPTTGLVAYQLKVINAYSWVSCGRCVSIIAAVPLTWMFGLSFWGTFVSQMVMGMLEDCVMADPTMHTPHDACESENAFRRNLFAMTGLLAGVSVVGNIFVAVMVFGIGPYFQRLQLRTLGVLRDQKDRKLEELKEASSDEEESEEETEDSDDDKKKKDKKKPSVSDFQDFNVAVQSTSDEQEKWKSGLIQELKESKESISKLEKGLKEQKEQNDSLQERVSELEKELEEGNMRKLEAELQTARLKVELRDAKEALAAGVSLTTQPMNADDDDAKGRPHVPDVDGY